MKSGIYRKFYHSNIQDLKYMRKIAYQAEVHADISAKKMMKFFTPNVSYLTAYPRKEKSFNSEFLRIYYRDRRFKNSTKIEEFKYF